MIKKNSILIVDDHAVFRQGLRLLLEKETDLKVVGEAEDGEIAIDMVRKLSPDIVVMDISMPNLDGIQATRQIISEFPDTKVVALSVQSEKRFVRGMLQAGAAGYILKESASQEIVQGIRTVLAGNVYLSRSISKVVVTDYSRLMSEMGDTAEVHSEPILRTKLHPPRVTADIIPRTRLVKLLVDGCDRAMTLISAPAGYGKSIVASQWLGASSRPGAWVSLDESENDLREFLTYFLAAIQNLFPSKNLKTQSLLQAANIPPAKDLCRYVLNDLEHVETPFILVLDDYHHIRDNLVHDFLRELLHHPSPMLHLALLTRRDPPLPLTQLRAYGQLTEIVVDDLRFTVEETSALLERFLRVTIDKDTASVLEEKVEGWVSGLRLAALSLRQSEDHGRILQELRESTHFVQDYLFKEVFLHTPKASARFLMETSILDRFCAPLCDVLHSPDEDPNETQEELTGQAFIDWLEETHLFVISLDENRRWYRYHHLFQELLQDQMKQAIDPDGVAALNTRASEWFEGKGLIEEALHHALMAEDVERAARIVESNRQSALNADRMYLLERWLSHLPDSIVQQRPELLLARAWVFNHQLRFDALLPVLDQAESLLREDAGHQALHGELGFFRGYLHFFLNDGARSLEHLKQALKRIPASSYEVRAETEIFFGLASQMEGRKNEALRMLDGRLNAQPPPNDLERTRLLVAMVYLHIISGDLSETEPYSRRLNETASAGHFAYAEAWSHYLLGLVHLYRYELDVATVLLQRSVEQRFVHHRRAAVDSFIGLMLAYEAAGRRDEAQATQQLLREYATALDDPATSALVGSCEARLALLQGRLEHAIHWLETSVPPVPEVMIWWLEVPCLTHCRVLIADGSAANLKKADKLLHEYAEMNEAQHNTCQMVEILTLQAMTSAKQSKAEDANTFLERALARGQPGGFVFPFLEHGPPMVEMLKHMRTKNIAKGFISLILTAFEKYEQRTAPAGSSPHAAVSPASGNTPPAQKLSRREREVLAYLAEGLSNREIASRLFISSMTTKKHLYNIYKKLDVNTRTGALNRARELDILPHN